MTKKSRTTARAKGDTKPRRAAPKARHAARGRKPGASAEARVQATQGRRSREGTKQALLIEMLRRPAGATIAEIMTTTGWQAHTVRGAIAGALKKKLGLAVASEKVENRGRVYRIAG